MAFVKSRFLWMFSCFKNRTVKKWSKKFEEQYFTNDNNKLIMEGTKNIMQCIAYADTKINPNKVNEISNLKVNISTLNNYNYLLSI